MNKFIKDSLFFVLFFAIFFALVNIFYLGLLVSVDEGFKKRLQSLKFDNPDFELLVLGTSFAEYGIDTEYLTTHGIKSFNLALAGNSFETSYIQLKEYLIQYTQRPEYVLLVLNSFKEPTDSEIIEPVIEATMLDYKYGLKDVPVLRFTWLGTEMIKKVLSRKHRKARLSYGQVKFEKSNPDNTDYYNNILNLELIEVRSWGGEIAKLCDKNGIRFMVIEIPGFKETQNISEIGPHELHFDNGHSATLYNFNSQEFCKIFDSKKDWIGRSHLNEFGATKFTKELLRLINSQATTH
jgi:hypothetical protein